MERSPAEPEVFRSYRPAHTRQQLTSLLVRVFDANVERLMRVDLGTINAVYEAHLSSGLDCFVKVAPASAGHRDLGQEVWAFAQAGRIGLPTPEVLAYDPAPAEFPEPYHITRRIPGMNARQADLTPDQRAAALRTLGVFLARLHTVPVEGFGTLHPEGAGFVGSHASQWKDIVALLEGAWWRGPLLQSGLVTEADLARLDSLMKADQPLFAQQHACLVWQDAGLKNLVVEEGVVTGMVDLENVGGGTPLNDFALMDYETQAELAAVKDGYGAPALFNAAFDRAWLLLRLLYAYPTLASHYRRGNAARVSDLQTRIQQLLTALGH